MTSFRAACVQLRSGRDPEHNLDDAERLIREARRDGAEYIQTPEQTATMEMNRKAMMAVLSSEDDDEGLKRMQALAEELDIWLHIGSMSFLVKTCDDVKAVNRSLLISPAGRIAARYDKIHMFDVDLENGESYRESAQFRSGREGCQCHSAVGHAGVVDLLRFAFPLSLSGFVQSNVSQYSGYSCCLHQAHRSSPLAGVDAGKSH